MEGFSKQPHKREQLEPEIEYGPKTEHERYRLRQALLALGISVTTVVPESDTTSPEDRGDEPHTEARVTGSEGEISPDIYTADDALYTTRPPAAISDRLTENSNETFAADEEVADSIQENTDAPHFSAYTEAARTAYTMRRDQVVLTDSWGRMLGDGPVDLYDAAGYTPEEMTWRHEGGEPVGIPGMLTDELREKMSVETGVPVSEISVLHTYLGMKKDEFVQFNSLQEAALHNALKIVPGDTAKRNFLEVVEDEFTVDIAGPDGALLAAGLREYLPALISKESLFSVTAVSAAGAQGALQFMPQTWQQYAPEGADPTSFVEAVRAAGKYFAASYEYLYKNSLNELDVIESEFFAGDHESFVKEFVLLCLINGYNAGDGTMRQALEHFAREYGTQDALQAFYKTTEAVGGRDVFFAFTRIESQNETVPLYGPYAGEYALAIDARRQAGIGLQKSDTRVAELTD